MKQTLKLLLTGLILAGSPVLLKAQVPQKFNYQGIARDTKGNPMGKQTLGIKLSVLPTADATTPEYEEVQTITTNEFGLYTLQIGNGTAVTGTMKEVKWETGNKYIKVAIDPQGGTNYADAGTTQLLSVPYAIYADKAGMAKETAGGDRAGAVSTSAAGTGTVNFLTKFTAANTIYNSQVFDNGTNIGIGTTTPAATAKIHINQNSASVLEHMRMQNLSATGAGRFTLYSDGASNYSTFTKYGSTYAGGYAGITTLYPLANLLAFGNNGVAANDGLGRFLISTAGNAGISIFKGGTSKLKFHADFTTENVGIGGNSAPVGRVHMNNTDGTTMDVRLTNNTTGHTATDGLDIRNTGNDASITNRENANLTLGTNNVTRMTVTAAGNVELANQIKIAGGAPGAGKVLTSDATGLATWQTPAAGGGVSGSGTVNYIPKFTPNGTTLGNSSLVDNGSALYFGRTSQGSFFGVPFGTQFRDHTAPFGFSLFGFEGKQNTGSFLVLEDSSASTNRGIYFQNHTTNPTLSNDKMGYIQQSTLENTFRFANGGGLGLEVNLANGRMGNYISTSLSNAELSILSSKDTAAYFVSDNFNGTGNYGVMVESYSDYSPTGIFSNTNFEGTGNSSYSYGIINLVNGGSQDAYGAYNSVVNSTGSNSFVSGGINYATQNGTGDAYGSQNSATSISTTTTATVFGSYNDAYAPSNSTGRSIGVYSYASGGDETVIGVSGFAQGNYDLTNGTNNPRGIFGDADGGSGNSDYTYSIYGAAPTGGFFNNYSGYFEGNTHINGTLSKAGGTFKIDHPQDPANKYLVHSFVESPDMMNVYNGNIVTDASGNAVVELPAYFQAENKDFKYQLTVIDNSNDFVMAKVSSEVNNNTFSIKTSKPNVKVSWQVTGVRQDAWANANRVEAEVEKADREKGKYLHPELFGQDASKGLHHSERMTPKPQSAKEQQRIAENKEAMAAAQKRGEELRKQKAAAEQKAKANQQNNPLGGR
jgi:hypothetical protein